MMSTLEGLHAYADRLATSEQDKRGTCRSQWIIVRENDAHIVSTPWGDEIEKKFHTDWLRDTFAMDQSIERFAFVAEVWMFDQHDKVTDTFGRRYDALSIHTQQRDGNSCFTTYEVVAGAGRRNRRISTSADIERLSGPLSELFQVHPSTGFGPH